MFVSNYSLGSQICIPDIKQQESMRKKSSTGGKLHFPRYFRRLARCYYATHRVKTLIGSKIVILKI